MRNNGKVHKTDKSDFEQRAIVLLKEIHHRLKLLLKDMAL
jgi:two-component sensor histidine kinase